RAGALAALDTFEPRRCAPCSAARQHPPPIEEKLDGQVDEEVAHPHPSQTRMCRFPASGSSWESLARGGADDTIRDLPVGRPPSFPCMFSFPLSFRGQVCETQSSLPCFPSTVLSARHLPGDAYSRPHRRNRDTILLSI